MGNKIMLLDLNFTLAEKVEMGRGYYNVQKDRYSVPLVKLLGGFRGEIHLLTARTEDYKLETLNKIEKDVGFMVDKAVFKPLSQKFVKVQFFKREYAQGLINDGVSPKDIIAVESNSKTKAEYRLLGITEMYTRDEYLKEFGSEPEHPQEDGFNGFFF